MLDGALFLHNLPIALLGGIPRLVLYFYAMTRLLDMRHPRPCFCVCSVAAAVVVSVLPFAAPVVRFAAMMALCLLPAFMARNRPSHSVLIVVASIVVLVASDSAMALLWLGLVGADLTVASAGDNLAAYAVVSGVHLLLLGAIYAAFHRYANRFLNADVQRYSGEGPKYFVMFPLIQLPFLIIAAVGIFQVDSSWAMRVVALMLSMSLLALGADLLLFYSVEQFVLEQREAARVDVLRSRLDADLHRYRQLALVLENSAQLRHDIRNQVQVINALADRGEFDRARACVAELLGEIEQIDAFEKEAAAPGSAAFALDRSPSAGRSPGDGAQAGEAGVARAGGRP